MRVFPTGVLEVFYVIGGDRCSRVLMKGDSLSSPRCQAALDGRGVGGVCLLFFYDQVLNVSGL